LMHLADILVSIDASDQGRARMRAAMGLATRFGAAVTGFYVSPTQGVLAPASAATSPWLGDAEGMSETAGDIAEMIRTEFEGERKAAGLRGTWVLGHESADSFDLIARARCADLVVAGLGPVPGLPAETRRVDIEAVVVGCGRPVLGLPVANLPEIIG